MSEEKNLKKTGDSASKTRDFTFAQADNIVRKKFDFSVLSHTMGEIKTGILKMDRASANLKIKQQKNNQKFFKLMERRHSGSSSDDFDNFDG